MEHGSSQLKDWIARSHLNQREAAQKLELHYTTLNKILQGSRPPGRETAIVIEAVTGIPVAAWSTRVGKTKKSPKAKARKHQYWQAGNAHAS